MTIKDLQMHLDFQKWTESEKVGEDLCGKLPYCEVCEGEEEYPCAKAYNRFYQSEKKAAKNVSAPKATTKPAVKTEAKPAVKEEAKPAVKTEAKPAAKVATKPAANKEKVVLVMNTKKK